MASNLVDLQFSSLFEKSSLKTILENAGILQRVGYGK